ncbi:MAG TPA: hypothetical protein VMS77_09825, partial [Conexivisphaerales archaeon]|nr:hypothetical protein [Conexivisphaerales archaeon]
FIGFAIIVLGFLFLMTYAGCPSGPNPNYCRTYIRNMTLFDDATFTTWGVGLFLMLGGLFVNRHRDKQNQSQIE